MTIKALLPQGELGVPVSVGVKVEWRTTGPAEAAALLKQSHEIKNRRTRDSYVSRLADEMRGGRWLETGSPIQLTSDEAVIDGRHRLFAVIEAGVYVKFLFVVGVHADAIAAIDVGTPRRLSDYLHMRDIPNAEACASLINNLWRWDHRGTLHRSTGAPGDIPSIQQALTYYADHRDEITTAVTKAVTKPMRVLGYQGVLAALCALFARIDEDDTEVFFEKLVSGSNLGVRDPILLLRKRLLEARGVQTKPSSAFIAAIGIKAWNAYREGRTLGLLRWTPGGASPEPFPRPT